jgi:acetyltransferase-like isoleucine patch superfamily enzyme
MISDVQIQSDPPRADGISPGPERQSLRGKLATSQGFLPRVLRRGYRAVRSFSIPAPRVLIKPLLWLFMAARECYQFALRVFVCEPLFKAYCKKYGRRLRTDCYVHFVQGAGDIILGDDVIFDGRITITFAARFADHPLLEVGNNTAIGHNCEFRIGKRISIGNNCNLSGGTILMDSNGHPGDPQLRWTGRAPDSEDVRPIVIRDGVWIGLRCIIFPGVKIGEGSIVSAGSIIRNHVPPYSVVAGNPAKVMFRLKKPSVAWGPTQEGRSS